MTEKESGEERQKEGAAISGHGEQFRLEGVSLYRLIKNRLALVTACGLEPSIEAQKREGFGGHDLGIQADDKPR